MVVRIKKLSVTQQSAFYAASPLFADNYVSRIVIAISAHKSPVGEGPERITLILSLLGCHPRAFEHHSVVFFTVIFRHRLNLEPSIRSVRKVVVDKFEVVDAPDSLVAERTVAGLEHRNVR